MTLGSKATVTVASCVLLTLHIPRAGAQSPSDTEAARRLYVFRALGPTASITVYPVQVLGKPDSNVADALGLLLEKFGMDQLEATESAFAPPPETAWNDLPAHFGGFIKQNPPKTQYALYAEFLGTPKSGPTEVRWLLADATGQLVLTDRQTSGDADFKRTAARDPDPMGCSVLVAERLFSQAGWKKSTGAGRADGRFARKWAEKSGTPDASEQAAMQQRASRFKAAVKQARVAVYATHVNNAPDAPSAARLAPRLAKEFGCEANAVDTPLEVVIRPTSNQQKRLWDLARAFREHLRKNAPEADYALLAEYTIDTAGGRGHSVHVVVCEKSGDWVIVDFQNDQHDDFRALAPKSAEDCEQLTIQRLERYLR